MLLFVSIIKVYVNTYSFIYIYLYKRRQLWLILPQESFIMFECDFQSTNILLLKMTGNINQKHSRKKIGYLINLREEHKVKQIPGHENVAVN